MVEDLEFVRRSSHLKEHWAYENPRELQNVELYNRIPGYVEQSIGSYLDVRITHRYAWDHKPSPASG
jgi:hypothetical protein